MYCYNELIFTNITCYAHHSTSSFGQWESAVASAIVPSAAIAHWPKLKHKRALVEVVYNSATVITFKQRVHHSQ